MKIISFHGAPLSGKDTQADLFIKKHTESSLVKISTGQIIRDAASPTNRFHAQIGPHLKEINAGGYLKDNIMIPAALKVMNEEMRQGREGILFSGFPKTKDQLTEFERWIHIYEKLGIDLDVSHILLRVDPEVLESRLQNRAENGRADDTLDILRVRLDGYAKIVEPMLDILRSRNSLVEIDGNRTVDEVQQDITRFLREGLHLREGNVDPTFKI